MRNRQNRSGFTLIEILLAASITVIVFTAIYSVFYAGMHSYKKVNAYSSNFWSARAVLNRLSCDLRNSFIYSNIDSGFTGDSKNIEFFTKISIFNGDLQDSLEVAKIKYLISGNKLIRQEKLGADVLRSQPSGLISSVVSSINDVKFEYALPINDALNSYEWVDSWPKDEVGKSKLPLAVKVVLFAGNPKQEFQRVISLPLEVIND